MGWDGMGECPTPARHAAHRRWPVSQAAPRWTRSDSNHHRPSPRPAQSSFQHAHLRTHTHTHPMSIHGPDRGHRRPYAKPSVECLRSSARSGVTVAVVHSPGHDARGQGRATRHRIRTAGLEAGEACQSTSHSPQLHTTAILLGIQVGGGGQTTNYRSPRVTTKRGIETSASANPLKRPTCRPSDGICTNSSPATRQQCWSPVV